MLMERYVLDAPGCEYEASTMLIGQCWGLQGAATVIGGAVIVSGGQDTNRNVLGTVERLSPAPTGPNLGLWRWEPLCDMLTKRTGHQVPPIQGRPLNLNATCMHHRAGPDNCFSNFPRRALALAADSDVDVRGAGGGAGRQAVCRRGV